MTSGHEILRIRGMEPRELEHALDLIEFAHAPFTAEWAALVLEEAERRGIYDISEEPRASAAAPGLDDFDLLDKASQGKPGPHGFADLWLSRYAAEFRRRWAYEEACNLYRDQQRSGWLSEDLPPQTWWTARTSTP